MCILFTGTSAYNWGGGGGGELIILLVAVYGRLWKMTKKMELVSRQEANIETGSCKTAHKVLFPWSLNYFWFPLFNDRLI